MAFSISGKQKVKTMRKNFKEEFGLTIRIYDGRSFADDDSTVAQIRTEKTSGNLEVRKNMKVGNLEDKIMKDFGIKTQIAGSDDSYLCNNDLTLAKALEEDAKKLERKEKKSTKQTESSTKDNNPSIENSSEASEEENGEDNICESPITLNYTGQGGEMYILGLTDEQTKKYIKLAEDENEDEELLNTLRQGPDDIESRAWIMQTNGGEVNTINWCDEDGNDCEIEFEEDFDDAIDTRRNLIRKPIDIRASDINRLKDCVSLLVYREASDMSCSVEINAPSGFVPSKLSHIAEGINKFDDSYRVDQIEYNNETQYLEWGVECADCEVQFWTFKITDGGLVFDDIIAEFDYEDKGFFV